MNKQKASLLIILAAIIFFVLYKILVFDTLSLDENHITYEKVCEESFYGSGCMYYTEQDNFYVNDKLGFKLSVGNSSTEHLKRTFSVEKRDSGLLIKIGSGMYKLLSITSKDQHQSYLNALEEGNASGDKWEEVITKKIIVDKESYVISVRNKNISLGSDREGRLSYVDETKDYIINFRATDQDVGSDIEYVEKFLNDYNEI